jgi:hypothetical protein
MKKIGLQGFSEKPKDFFFPKQFQKPMQRYLFNSKP